MQTGTLLISFNPGLSSTGTNAKRRIRYGPDKYCQGLSPGGGNSCTDIPADCYIVVPEYNVEPKVECDL